MLSIKNVDVLIDNKKVLSDFSLDIDDGSIHVIMGPNGGGKSTLSKVIMGDNNYKIVSGDILFNGQSIKNMTTDARSRMGIFLAMQYPTEIAGISNQDFLRTALSQNENKRIGLYDFILKCEKASDELKMDKSLIHRSLNVGFSGGERKKIMLLRLLLTKPQLAILDEPDSGADAETQRIIATTIESMPNTTFLIISHQKSFTDLITWTGTTTLSGGKVMI